MPTKYRHHKYTWSRPVGSIRHSWQLLGPLGGLELNVGLIGGDSPTCGVEYHHTEACGHNTHYAPDHIDCKLTGGRCWHEGSSLYASETIWSVVSGYLLSGNHGAIFAYLDGIADERFNKFERPIKTPGC